MRKVPAMYGQFVRDHATVPVNALPLDRLLSAGGPQAGELVSYAQAVTAAPGQVTSWFR